MLCNALRWLGPHCCALLLLVLRRFGVHRIVLLRLACLFFALIDLCFAWGFHCFASFRCSRHCCLLLCLALLCCWLHCAASLCIELPCLALLYFVLFCITSLCVALIVIALYCCASFYIVPRWFFLGTRARVSCTDLILRIVCNICLRSVLQSHVWFYFPQSPIRA